MSFPYKRVLLIGATSGIGLGMANKLIASGIKVIAVGRRADRLDAFVAQHGADKASAIPFDMTHTDSFPSFVEKVTTAYPDLDCVFLNSGNQHGYNFAKPSTVDLATFHDEMALNFSSFVSLTHAFLPFLLAKGQPTSLIYTASHLSLIPATTIPAYSASKAALNAFIMCLRDQLSHAKSNVKVIELWPPPVQTELHDSTMGEAAGRKFGMPLDAFTEEAYKGLSDGKDHVIVGNVGPDETFMEIVDKRRAKFEWLAGMMRAF